MTPPTFPPLPPLFIPHTSHSASSAQILVHPISMATMSAPKISARSSELLGNAPLPTPGSSPDQHITAIAAYERYLRLPELSKIWSVRLFPDWRNEPIVKPALQALEITFRLLSIVLTDPRPYANHRQWMRRLESLCGRQIELIAVLCEDDSGAPAVDLGTITGVLTRDPSSQEVWKLPGTSSVVSRTSEASLLPRLAAWDKSEDAATNILFQIEAQMRRCPFTLGLGEPNLAGKSNLEYDLIVQPSELHSLKRSPTEKNLPVNDENQILFSVQQIVESWINAARELLRRIDERIDSGDWEACAGDCWILEGIWKLLAEAEGMLILTDPDDFIRLKNELAIRSAGAFCFRSAWLLDITSRSRELKRRVPKILGVEVDRNGGPRVQQAAMGLFHSRRRGEAENAPRIHLLQAFQAVESAVKRFYFACRQLVTAVTGSVEATGNGGVATVESSSEIFLEPPYFPSLDAAKTFLGEYWNCNIV